VVEHLNHNPKSKGLKPGRETMAKKLFADCSFEPVEGSTEKLKQNSFVACIWVIVPSNYSYSILVYWVNLKITFSLKIFNNFLTQSMLNMERQVTCLLAEKHFANRPSSNKHLTYRHLAKSHLVNRHFAS
jgi:hypothetical protein